MGDKTGIEWTAKRDATGKIVMPGATWNPWHGCHKIDLACKFCYMYREKRRYGQDPNVVVRSKTTFYDPLEWTEPRYVFTCSWSDWCIEEADEWRDEAWSIIKRTPHLTYQILTKRTDRLELCLPSDWNDGKNYPHVWLGFSAGTQESFDRRWKEIQGIKARVWFLSAEPLLERLCIEQAVPMMSVCRGQSMSVETAKALHRTARRLAKNGGYQMLDWVIAGGETGEPHEKIRATHVDDFRYLRDQCRASLTPFTFKQWGDYLHESQIYRDPLGPVDDDEKDIFNHRANRILTQCRKPPEDRAYQFDDTSISYRVGKKAAGRHLDGVIWNQMPELEAA